MYLRNASKTESHSNSPTLLVFMSLIHVGTVEFESGNTLVTFI